MSRAKSGGTEGRVYGGNPALIHVMDGTRAELGEYIAGKVAAEMRIGAVLDGTRSLAQAYGTEGHPLSPTKDAQKLCPGCYMVVLFNAAVKLAQENGQSLSELGNSMAEAFRKLAEGGSGAIEEIEVLLDPCEVEA